MPATQKTILLAEDDKFISKAYTHGFEEEGFDVVVAVNGEEALSAMRNKKPDIILLDIMMSSMNGFEVLEEMMMDKKLKNIPVIILSNLGQESDIEKAKALGVAEYLVKSNYSLKDIIEKVKFHLAKKH